MQKQVLKYFKNFWFEKFLILKIFHKNFWWKFFIAALVGPSDRNSDIPTFCARVYSIRLNREHFAYSSFTHFLENTVPGWGGGGFDCCAVSSKRTGAGGGGGRNIYAQIYHFSNQNARIYRQIYSCPPPLYGIPTQTTSWFSGELQHSIRTVDSGGCDQAADLGSVLCAPIWPCLYVGKP